jgi:hypothetical protein
MRLMLDGAEVWNGMTFLGIVSAEWLATQIQDRLDSIAIAEWLQAELAADPRRRLGPPLEETSPMLPPSYTAITSATKAKRRAQRQKNKGRRAK